MNRRGILNGLISVTAALPLAGCWSDGTVVKRIKVIAKAEVDGNLVEGSSVTEVKWRPRGDGGMNADEHGEAVVLELADRGTVYVLSMSFQEDGFNNVHIWPSQVTRAAGLKGGIHKEDLPIIESLKGRFAFFPRNKVQLFPVMVAFKDETDFRSVYRVLPEDFNKHFGTGVKFIGIDFETTDEPVTEGILVKRLPVLLEKDRAVADPKIMKKAFVDWPFNYKVGQNTFFSKRRF